MKKTARWILVTAVLVTAFSCKGKEEAAQAGKRTVSFALWDEVQEPVFREIVKRFTAETGIEVDLRLTPWSTYWTKLDAAATAGNAADVIWMNIFLPKYADAGIIEPVEPYVIKDGLDKSQWSKAMLDLYTYQGKLYAMPKGMDVVAAAYNKAIFDKYGAAYPQEGWNWEDLRRIGGQLRDGIKAAGGGEYPVLMELDSQPSYLQFWLQDGVVPYGWDSAASQLSRPEAARAFEDILDLMDQQIMPSFQVLSDTKGTDLFISGRGAILFVGSWKAVVLDDVSFASQIGLIPMPARSVSNVCALGGISYALNARAADKDAAWQLIKYLGGETSNRLQAEGRIEIPAYLDAQQYYAPSFKNIDPAAFVTQSRSATVYPTHATFPQWIGYMNDIAIEIFTKQKTPLDGMKDLAAEVDRYLKE